MLCGDDLIFLPKVQTTFNQHSVTELDWDENSPNLNPTKNLCGFVKTKMGNIRLNRADEFKASVKTTWTSTTTQQSHRLVTSMPWRIDAIRHAKTELTAYTWKSRLFKINT